MNQFYPVSCLKKFSGLASKSLGFLFLVMMFGMNGWAQFTLPAGTSYTETFDGVGTALPNGWSVRTTATSTTRGTAATFVVGATTWANTTGQFANMASSDGLTASASTATQSASTDRVVGIRQSGSLGDPGAAIELVLTKTSGKTSFGVTLKNQMLDVQARSTTWSIQYSITGTSWTSIGTYTDPGTFGSSLATYSFGTGLDNISGNVYIRIVALTASTGSGSRDVYGLDDFQLSWTNTAVTPTITGAATTSAFTTTYGTASTAQSFPIGGTNLTANLVATAPAGFEVSSDGTTYGSTATFTQNSGIASGTLSIRLAASAAASTTSYNSQNIMLSSTGATTVNITTPSSGNAVNKKALTMSGLSVPASKVYNGTVVAVVNGTPALQTPETIGTGTSGDGKPYIGDVVSITGTATGSYNTKDVATASIVTYAGLSLTGAASGNYTLTIQSPSSATITPKELTYSGLSVPSSKVYDGTTTAVVSGTPTLQTSEAGGAGTTADGKPYSADVVSIAGTATGTYNSANVSTSTTVTYGGLSLAGAQSGNYSLTTLTAPATISQSPVAITGVTINDKAYDGNTTATLSGTPVLNGVVPGDAGNVSVTGTPTAAFGDAADGTNKPVTVSGYTLSGTAAGNYSLSQPALTGNITAQNLTITGLTGDNKLYDRTTTATASGTPSYSGLVNGETYAVTGTPAFNFTDANVGTGKTINTTGYTAPTANYTVTQPTPTGNITQVALTITGVIANNKVYDGTATATLSGTHVLNGVVPGDEANVSVSGTPSASFADAAIGTNKPVTVTGYTLSGSAAGNYSVSQPTGLFADVTSPTKTNQTITFNALTRATYGDASFILTATASSMLPVTYISSNPAVATVSGSTVIIIGVGNTIITASQDGNATYNPAPDVAQTLIVNSKTLIISGAAATNKVYDQTTDAVITGTLTGVIGTDDVTYSGTGTFDNASAGTGKMVTSTSTLSGADAGNYILMQPTGLTANITQKSLTITGSVAADKQYDGNTTATVTSGTLSGVISGDVVTLTQSGTFAMANIGTNIAVTSTSTISGADAANYSLTQPTGLTANITAKALTITGITANDKEYDGNNIATLSGTPISNGVVSGDDVTLSGTPSATFADKTVGTAKPVTVTGYTLSGTTAGNYTLSQPTGLTAAITQKPLTITGASATDKVYDGTVTATVTGGTLNGVVSGDVVTLTLSGVFSDANAGTAKTVTSTSTIGGVDAGNYSLTQPSLTGNITKANQTITFGALPAKTTTDADFSPGATSPTSGSNPITYTSSNTAVATITPGNLIHIMGAGTSIITASQAASTNYNAATPVSQTLTVTSTPVSIFTNPITGTNPNTANPYTAGQIIDPNITVTGIGRGTGITGSNANDRYNANGWNVATLDLNRYFTFTLTPNIGYVINFSSFVYTGQASGTGPVSFVFRSSADNFTANIATPTAIGTTISLSGSSYQNVNSAITFRLYGYGASASAGTFSVNDFTFSGNVICLTPTAYTVTGGGTYCSGGTGVPVGLNGSQLNVSYQLKLNGTNTGSAISGTGSAISFGNQTTVGTYTVAGSNTNGTCNLTTTMTGSATVTVNPLPTATISGTTIVCQNSTSPNITFTGAGGTAPYTFTYTINSSDNQTASNTSGNSVMVSVPTTTAGTYTYSLLSVSDQFCSQAQSGTVTITVTTPPSATINYGGSPYCSNGGTATVTQTGTPNGTYSSATGLVINATSGDVDLGASTAGTYTVTYTVAASGGCAIYTTTASITITEYPAGTIAYATPNYCPGTGTATIISTITPSGTTGTYTATPAGLSINSSTGTVDLSLSTSGTYTVTFTVAPANGCAMYQASTTITINIDTWNGSSSTDWNEGANWSCGSVPTINSDAVIPVVPNDGNHYYPSVATVGPPATVHNLTIDAGASLTVSAQTLQVSADINNNGIFDVSIGTLELNGKDPQSIPALAFTGNKIRNLIISNDVSLNGQDSLSGVLSFGASSKTFTTNNNLTLKSNISRTGSVGIIDNGNAISGNVTVERFIATGTGSSEHAKSWQLMAVPTTGGQTIRQSWMENASASNVTATQTIATNPVPGYGTMTTSNVANAATFPSPGFDAYTTPGPTVKTYNYATNDYSGTATTNVPVYDKRGYFVFVRGDRSVYTSTGTADHTILRTTGTLITPAVTQPVSTVPSNYFQSIGNPFASAVDMTKISVTGGNSKQYFYVWDPRIGGTYNYGVFVTFQLDATGNYEVQTNGGGSYPANGTVYNYLQNGQAFFMQADATGAGTVSFPETSKTPEVTFPVPFTRQGDGGLVSTSGARTSSAQGASLRTGLHIVNADGSTGSTIDETLNQFDDTYSNGVDGFDGRKMLNTGENLSIRNSSKLLAIEKRHTVIGNDTIFLNLTSARTQAYQFSIDAANLTTVDSGFVVDKYLNTRRQINLKGNTKINFNVTGVAASYAADRFMLVFVALKVLPTNITSVTAYQQSRGSHNINVDWSVNNEHNIQKYVVERSADSISFTKLTATKPTANDGSVVSYSVTDTKPVSGNNYYRVKMTDTNGNITYSTIVSVNIGAVKNNINIYPNPVTDGRIHLQFSNEAAGKYGIRLLNKKGEVIVQKQITRQQGSNTELLQWNYNLAHGMYQVEITRPDGTVKNIDVVY